MFGVGPAGTGKTFLAVAAGAAALKNKGAAKLIITRPAVEAGENLGFLPGDLEEKVEPYLRPIWDALDETLGADQALRMPPKTPSGLAHALRILQGVEGVGMVEFTARDVRRHALVSRIINAYDADAKKDQK